MCVFMIKESKKVTIRSDFFLNKGRNMGGVGWRGGVWGTEQPGRRSAFLQVQK